MMFISLVVDREATESMEQILILPNIKSLGV